MDEMCMCHLGSFGQAFNCVPYFHVLATCCVTCSSFQAQDVRLESTLCNPSQICCAKSKRNNPCKYVVLLHSAKLSPLKKYQGQRPLRSSHLSQKRAQCSRNHGSTAPFYTEVRNAIPLPDMAAATHGLGNVMM